MQWETTESIHSQVEINLFMHTLLQSEKRGKIIVSDLFFLHNFWLCCFFLPDDVKSSGLPTAASPANENRAAVMNTPDEDTACHCMIYIRGEDYLRFSFLQHRMMHASAITITTMTVTMTGMIQR